MIYNYFVSKILKLYYKYSKTQNYWPTIVFLIGLSPKSGKKNIISFLGLIETFFNSRKFSDMRRFDFEASNKFYSSTINLVTGLKTLAPTDAEAKIHYSRVSQLILNNCYYTDWFLYYAVKKMLGLNTENLVPVPRAFIKNLAIGIREDYAFDNSPFPSFDSGANSANKETDNIFIGRESIVAKFLKFLQTTSSTKKGVYLVTGYRGMGKTSFVNNVISRYIRLEQRKKKFEVIQITISLAQKQPSEIDILRLMVAHVRDQMFRIPNKSKFRKIAEKHGAQILQTSMFLVLIFLVLLFISSYVRRLDFDSGSLSSKEKNTEQIDKISYKINIPEDTLHENLPVKKYGLTLEAHKDFGSNSAKVFEFNRYEYYAAIVLIGILALAGTLLIFIKAFPRFLIKSYEQEFDLLYRRCFSSLVTEKSVQNEFSLEQFGAKFSSNGDKEVLSYPIASSKEIEYGMIKFLQSVRNVAEFIFVFDELDKIEPAAISTNYFEDSDSGDDQQGAYLQQSRERKQVIITIIAGLKNFLTTAEARFIFIAGREMFDATLADVADRQSSVGSIFNYVFYVQSFLRESMKDGQHSRGSMGQMIEKYMGRMLFAEHAGSEPSTFYNKIYTNYFCKDIEKIEELITSTSDETEKASILKLLRGNSTVSDDLIMENLKTDLQFEKKELLYQAMKTTIILQNFVNYLTYRSNGSPKKIIKTLHEFVRIRSFLKFENGLMIVSDRVDHFHKDTPYIFFNFKDQYRIGFINHLYRPFIIKNGESFKKYSDNIIISTTYLFDHLLKFHPFAFSFANLELIPEVLSTNKTPSLRDHIITIIDYLSNNHLRETEIGIFDYKFYSRTVNELIYISKTFEEESAAFNFTLDEGFLVKLHIRKELKELRKVYSAFSQPEDSLNSAFSITHLNGILGDLHFFDQEYDDAIVAYSNAVNELRYDQKELSLTDFVVLIRFLLKLGLTFEKVKNYDEALSFYTDAAERAKSFIMYRIKNGTYINSKKENELSSEEKIRLGIKGHYYTSMMSDLLQIVNQAFIAKIVLQEKMGIEGITALKFGLAVGSFFRLSKKVAEVCGRNYLINANLYLVLGNLLYFKNSHKGFEAARLNDHDEYVGLFNAYEPNELVRFFFLRENYKHLLKDYRIPSLSLFYYVLGLAEVIRSRYQDFDSLDFLFKPDPSAQYIRTLKEKLNEHNEASANVKIHYFEKDYGSVRTPNLIHDILAYFEAPVFAKGEIFTKGHYKYLAMFTSHIGDCILSMIKLREPDDNGYKNYLLEDIISSEALNLYETLDDTDFDFCQILKHTRTYDTEPTITDVLRCYYQAAQFFKKRGRMVSYSFQLRKILYTLRLVLKDLHNSITPVIVYEANTALRHRMLRAVETLVLNPILQVAGQTTENTDRYIVSKYGKLIQGFLPAASVEENKRKIDAYVLNNISSHPDSREALTLFMYIEIKTIVYSSPATYNKFLGKYEDFVNPYDSYATQYTRMYELGFWAKLNKIKFKNAITEDKKSEFAKEYLFAQFSQILTMDIYGLDYMISHSFKGYIHFHIGKFLQTEQSSNYAEQAIDDIKEHFGYNIRGALADPYYHFSMAKMHYSKTIELHKVGPEYLKNMDNMIYLEDDINDNAYHFGAALDRFLLTNNTISMLMNYCESQLRGKGKAVYELSSFLIEDFDPETDVNG